jgi:hypothetical protein
MTDESDYSATSTGLTDADVRRAMLRSIRLLGVLSAVAAAIVWRLVNWESAVLLLVGAAISCTSLWEWLRLMTAINRRMDAGGEPGRMGSVVVGFIARLGLTLAVLYVSLKYLHGSVFALAAGLGLGLLSLVVEASLLMKRPTS